MKTNLLTKLLCISSLVILVGSCNKGDQEIGSSQSSARIDAFQQPKDRKANSDETVSGDYERRGDMLFFKSVDAYLALQNKMKSMTTEEQIGLTQKLGFTSLADVYRNALTLIDRTQDKSEYDQILNQNRDIMVVKDGIITPTFNPVHATLLNRESMVSIGKAIHRFALDATIIAVDGDVAKVREAAKTLKTSYKSVKIFSYNNQGSGSGRRAASCSGFDQTRQSPAGNRRVHVFSQISGDNFLVSGNDDTGNGNYYYVRVYSLVQGVPTKTNFFGSWVGYSTGNTLYSLYSVDVTAQFPVNTTTHYDRNQLLSNDGSSISDMLVIAAGSWVPQDQVINYCPCFYSAIYTGGEYFQGYYVSGGVPTGGAPLTCP